MLTGLVLLYGVTIFAYICNIFSIFNRTKDINIYLISKILFTVLEGVVPLLIHSMYLTTGNLWFGSYPFDYSSNGIFDFYIVWLFSVIAYIFIGVGYHNRVKIVIGTPKKQLKKPKDNFSYDVLLEFTSFILFAVAVISMYLWTKAYGGIWDFIKNANAIRSNAGSIRNSMAFFKHPAGSIRLVSYAFFIMCAMEKKHRAVNAVMTVISVILSSLYCLASDGRMTAGFYFLTFAVIIIQIHYKKFNKIKLKTIIWGVIVAAAVMVLIMNMDDLTYYIRNGRIRTAKSNDEFKLLSEFSFLLASAQGAIKNSYTIGIRVFDDLGSGLFAWFPSSLKPSGLVNLWDLSTEMIGWSGGQCPFGIVTQGFFDLNVIGVALLPFFYGIIIKTADKQKQSSLFGFVIYAGLFYGVTRVVGYGLLYDFILGMFGLVLFILVYKFLCSFRNSLFR